MLVSSHITNCHITKLLMNDYVCLDHINRITFTNTSVFMRHSNIKNSTQNTWSVKNHYFYKSNL